MVRFCKFCGNQISAKAQFCKYCGNHVGKSRELKKRRALISSAVALFMVAVLIITAFWQPGFYWRIKYSKENKAIKTVIAVGSSDTSDMERYFDEDIFITIPEDAKTEEPFTEDYVSLVEWTDADMAGAKVLTATVSPEKSVAELGGGISIDFGDVNLSTEAELTVRVPEAKRVKDDIVSTVQRYEFSLEGQSEFAESVEITVPFETADENSFPEVYYYDRETGLSEQVPLDYDEDSGELTFYVSHFSDYDVVGEEVPDYDELIPMTKVNPNFRSFEEAIEGTDYVDTYISALKQDFGVIAETMYNSSQDCGDFCTIFGTGTSYADIFFDAQKGLGLSAAAQRAASIAKWGGNFFAGLGIVFSACAILNDVNKTHTFPEALKVIFVDHGLDVAAITVAGLGIAGVLSAPVTFIGGLMITTVSFMQRSQDEYFRKKYNGFNTAQELSYYTFSKNLAFDRYTGTMALKYNRNTCRCLQGINPYVDWKSCSTEKQDEANYKMMFGSGSNTDYLIDHAFVSGALSIDSEMGWNEVMAFCRNRYGLDQAIPMFEKYVDSYCGAFWSQPPAVKDAFVHLGNLGNSASGAVYAKYGYDPSPDEITTYKNNLKAKIMGNCENLIWNTWKDVWLESRKKAKASFKKFVNDLNATCTFNIDIKDENGKNLTLSEAGYKGCYIIMDSSKTKYKMRTPWEVDKNNIKMFECTFAAYLFMGEPDRFLVYKDKESFLNGETCIDTLSFSFKNPVTTVTKKKDDSIFGTWNISQHIGSLGSKQTTDLIDQSKMSYEQFKEEMEGELDDEQMQEYYNQLYGMYDQYQDVTYTGQLVIKDAGDGAVTATLTYDSGGAPPVKYAGTYDKSTGIISLSNTNPQNLDPGLTIPVKNEGGKLTFSIEVNYDSYMANYSYTMTGIKVSE